MPATQIFAFPLREQRDKNQRWTEFSGKKWTQFLKAFFFLNHKINGTDPTKCLFHATIFHVAKAINKLKKCRNEFSFLSFSSWLTYIFREQNRINFREKIHGFVMILFGFELRTMVLRWQLVSPGIAPRAVGTGGQGDPSHISLTLFQSRGGQFMPTTLLLSPSGFQTFLRHRTNVARPQNKSTKPRLILVVCCAVCTKEDSNSDKMKITLQKV